MVDEQESQLLSISGALSTGQSSSLSSGPLGISSTGTSKQHLSLEVGITPRGKNREPLSVNSLGECECQRGQDEHQCGLCSVLVRGCRTPLSLGVCTVWFVSIQPSLGVQKPGLHGAGIECLC